MEISEFAPKIQNDCRGKNILSIKQFDRMTLYGFFSYAKSNHDRNFREGKLTNRLAGKSALLYIREPSTRTQQSFHRAITQQSGAVQVDNQAELTSDKKAESFADGMAVRAFYQDAIVMRHKDEGKIIEAARAIQRFPEIHCPLINAGNGGDEHPTQALLDLYTIYKRFNGRMDDHVISVIGDLKKGRVAHSFLRGMNNFSRTTVYLVALPGFELPDEVRADLPNLKLIDAANVEEALSQSNIWCCNRTQRERMDTTEQTIKEIIINKELVDRCGRKDLLILHPLPRNDEIDPEVDQLPPAGYFKEQLDNGVITRMALLDLVIAE